MKLGDRTSPELASGRSRPFLLVPLGSTEQHGPHLPLDTDTRVALAVAEAVAARRTDVVVAPAVPYGASGEHAGFPGTVSIGTEALVQLVLELVRSTWPDWSRVVLVNGHGGNVEALTRVSSVLAGEGRPVDVWHTTVEGGDAHAGRTETSLLLAIAPEVVRLDRARPGALEPLDELLPRLRVDGVRAVSPNGVLGDPTGASAAEGVRLLALLAESLAATLPKSGPTRSVSGVGSTDFVAEGVTG